MALIDKFNDPAAIQRLVDEDVELVLTATPDAVPNLVCSLESLALYQTGLERGYFTTKKSPGTETESLIVTINRLFQGLIKPLFEGWTVEKKKNKLYYTVSLTGASRYTACALAWEDVAGRDSNPGALSLDNAGLWVIWQKLVTLHTRIHDLLIPRYLSLDYNGLDKVNIYLAKNLGTRRVNRYNPAPIMDLGELKAHQIFLNLEQLLPLRQEFLELYKKFKTLRQTYFELHDQEEDVRHNAVVNDARDRARQVQEAWNQGRDLTIGELHGNAIAVDAVEVREAAERLNRLFEADQDVEIGITTPVPVEEPQITHPTEEPTDEDLGRVTRGFIPPQAPAAPNEIAELLMTPAERFVEEIIHQTTVANDPELIPGTYDPVNDRVVPVEPVEAETAPVIHIDWETALARQALSPEELRQQAVDRLRALANQQRG